MMIIFCSVLVSVLPLLIVAYYVILHRCKKEIDGLAETVMADIRRSTEVVQELYEQNCLLKEIIRKKSREKKDDE